MKVRWICAVCGYVHRGSAPPTTCPSCGAPFTSFQRADVGPQQRLRGIEIAQPRPSGFRYVIIGNSAAGRSAARAIAFLDPEGDIVVLSEEQVPIYARPLLPDFIAGYDREDFLSSGQAYETDRVRVLLGEKVTAVDPQARLVTCASGLQLPYDALLLATGSSPVQVPWPGSEAEGIAYFRSFADAERIAALVRTAERAVVVGGGLLGLEFVRAFTTAGLKVTQLVRETYVGFPALDEAAGRVLGCALANMGVEVVLGDEVQRFEADGDGRVAAVHTKGGRVLATDLVGVAVGVRPRMELAEKLDLARDRGILVDERFATSVPGIYAAGDVAQVKDYLTGERRVITSWRNSDEQGEHAGIAMAGGVRPYPGGVPANYQLAAGLPFCSLGVSNPAPEAGYETDIAADESELTYRKLVTRGGRVMGAVLMGNLDEAPRIEQEIRPPAPSSVGAEPNIATELIQERETTMKKMTEQFVKEAFAGESQAHMKYLNFAEKAEEEGKTNVARLFRAASYSEQLHASAHLAVLEGVGSTSDNLAAAVGGEGFEIAEMYPAYMAVAEDQGEEDAKVSFHQALEAEKVHHGLYERAKTAVDAGGDLDLGQLWVCTSCGYTMEGEPPARCPVCTAPRKLFTEF